MDIGGGRYKAIVPSGTIPAVVVRGAAALHRERFVLSESACIVEYLDEISPDPPLLPPLDQPERRAQLRFALRLHDLYIAPKVQALFPHVDPRYRDMAAVKVVLAELRVKLEQLSAEADRHSAGPEGDAVFDGHQFSLVDCCVPVTVLLAERLAGVLGQPDLLGPGRLQRWMEAVVLHPSLASVVAESQAATDEWLRRKLSGDDASMENNWWDVGRRRYDQASAGIDLTSVGSASAPLCGEETGAANNGLAPRECSCAGHASQVETALRAVRRENARLKSANMALQVALGAAVVAAAVLLMRGTGRSPQPK